MNSPSSDRRVENIGDHRVGEIGEIASKTSVVVRKSITLPLLGNLSSASDDPHL